LTSACGTASALTTVTATNGVYGIGCVPHNGCGDGHWLRLGNGGVHGYVQRVGNGGATASALHVGNDGATATPSALNVGYDSGNDDDHELSATATSSATAMATIDGSGGD
jgi:hypothetical protein